MQPQYPNKRRNSLSAAFVKNAPAGKFYDENGLFLKVEPGGSRRWVQRIVIQGKRRDIGLGSWPLISLREARQAEFENRKLARAGGDPLALKSRPDVPTFAEAIETVIGIHEPGWKDGGKTAKHWRATLRDYALRELGRKRVSDITAADVMSVLLPIWTTKSETARRVRQRIGAVMKWAIAQGFRQDNPAGEEIGAALPKTNGVRQHLRALPHSEVAAAIATIRGTDAYRATVLAFELLVLTAARSSEVRLARWHEMDMEAATWTIPAERMKMKREHRVPLSSRALAVLREAHQLRDRTGLVFPSVTGRPLTDSTISKLVRENGLKAVPHGFRSSFRSWCAECSDAPREVCELALAHVNSDRVEAAYMRTDVFERRRRLMEQWSEYLAKKDS